MYDEDKEKEFEKEAKEILFELDETPQKKMIIAIDDLFDKDPNITWEFIATALKKKSLDNWSKKGGGLLFNRNFKACVYEQMERNREAEEMDTRDFFSILFDDSDDTNSYEPFPLD